MKAMKQRLLQPLQLTERLQRIPEKSPNLLSIALKEGKV